MRTASWTVGKIAAAIGIGCWLGLSGVAQGQVTVAGSTGADGSYGTLTAAFAAINANTNQTGNVITVSIVSDTSEGTGTAILNQPSGGSWTSLTITPSGARTISGATTAGSPMIDFSGADNVTVDGLNSSGNSLIIENTTASATSGTSTIRFIGGATGNTITRCSLKGSVSSSVTTNGAIVFFSTDAATANGNDNNTISNCDIGPSGANLPTKAILGNGSQTTTAIGNSGIVIDNNDIHDVFGAAVTSSAIATNGGCNTWTITNNRIYQTGTRTWTTGAAHIGIDIRPSSATHGAQGFTITGNTIGYATNAQTGTYTLTGAVTGEAFRGIVFNGITGGTVSNINGNTIASVSLTGSTSSGTGTSSPFMGILAQNGLINTNSNTIGSQGATGSLTFSTTTTTSTDVYGIYNFSFDDWTANSNNIGGISVTNAGASGTFLVYGMRANTSTSKVANASSNNIGGTVANSIQLSATGVSSQVIGLATNNAAATFTSNTVRNLTSNVGTGTTTGASLIGIMSTTTSTNHTMSQNTIHTLTNTSASTATTITGIQYTSSTGTNLIARNFIHSFSAASATAVLNGIQVGGGTATYQNNMIRLGIDAAGNAITTGLAINGINEPSATGTDKFYFNSVFVGGGGVGDSANTFAFNSLVTTNVRAFQDNIFYNNRSNGAGTGKHYAVQVGGTAPNPAGLTIDYNDYLADGTGGVFGRFNSLDVASLAAWKTAVGQDVNSVSGDPQFVAPNGSASTVDLHINASNPTVIESAGTAIGSVTDDFDGQLRASFTPTDIGADAGNFTPNGGACCLPGGGCTFVADATACTNAGGSNFQNGVSCAGSTCAPANDNCASATALALSASYTAGSTSNATNDGSSTCDATGRDVWYTVTLTGAAILSIDTCTSAIDTVATLYSGACGSLTEVVCNDDCTGTPCGATGSCLTTGCLSAGTYRIRISDKNIASGGSFNVRAQTLPCNDLCADATVISSLPFSDSPNAVNATDDIDVTCNSGTATQTRFGVWYTYTPATNCTAAIAETSSNDTVTAIFTGSCGGLTQVACSDPETSAFPMVGGTQYWILVGMFSATATPSGPYGITFDCIAPPSNDLCGGATVVGSLPYTDNVSGAAATDDQDVTCNSSSATNTRFGVWYVWTAPSNCKVRIEQLNSSNDTIRAVFTGACGGLTQVACFDTETGSGTEFTPVSGTTYYILEGMWSATTAPTGQYQFKLSFAPVANDTCATATTISTGSGTATVSGDNSCGATDDGLTPSCNATTSKDLWWTFTTTASQAGNWRINTCGSLIDTVLTVYSGGCTTPVEVTSGCNDDATTGVCSGSQQSEVLVALAASTQYWVRVASSGTSAGGAITLNLQAEIPPANDNCSTATAVSISGNCPTGTATGSNQFADPALDGTQPPMCVTASKDVFYTVTIPTSPAGTNNWIFDTCTAGAQDTVLQVLDGCGGAELGCNDDTAGCGDGTQSKVTVSLLAGAIVKVRVASKGAGAAGGTFTLTVKLTPPANDLCSSAQPVSEGSWPWYNNCATTDGIGWTASTAPPAGCDATDSASNANSDVWFVYTATCTALTQVDTCGAGSLSDTVLVVYPVGICPPPNDSKLACDDDFDAPDTCATGGTLRSVLHFPATKGTQYLIRVGSFSGTTQGSGTLNISQPADTTPPTITTCAGDQTANADANCQAAVPDFTGGVVASDNCLGALTVEQSPTAGTLVGLGDNLITITVKDAANNTSAPCTAHFMVSDVTAPTIQTCAGDQTGSADANCQAAVPDFTAGVTASDNCTATGSLAITQTPTAGTLVGLGPTVVTISVKDAANNESTCQAMFTVSDTTPPSIADCPADIGPVPTDMGQPTAVVTWTAPTASDNCNLVSFTSTHNSGDAFPVGVTSVTYTAVDGAGLMSTCVFSVTVVDNESPVIHDCPKTIMADADQGQCSTTVTWTPPTATDNQPGVSIVQTQGPVPGSSFPVGTTHIQYTATDVSNNTATCDFDVTVVDNQDPVISDCPGNISLGTEAPNCSAVATWTAPTASDNCAIQTFVSTHNSGDTFPLGMTIVTYTATDVHGRMATCSFTVTVSDDDAPSITQCASDQSASADANCQAAVPDFTAGVTATDNCTASGSLVITQSPVAGTLVGLGPTSVTISVKDAANNESTCNATFTVNDTTPPSIVDCPGNITSNTNAPNCAAVVSWTVPTATDNCGASINQTQGPANGSTFANGSTTTIEYTATDGTNSAVCSFTVTVTATPDVNNDSVVNSSDVGPFIQVLLGLDNTPLRVYRSDTNCDGLVDGRDIQGMVNALIP